MNEDLNGVWLVGFGPGDPELLTLKAYRILQHAQVILHDDLIHTPFLNEFNCTKIYVGKRKGSHHRSQDEINQMLYSASCNYKTVVRLKGGDPFIFGRGGEELQYLQARGVTVRVIPGITSAVAAAASAQIPLTHRNISSQLTFLSAHNIDSIERAYPTSGTLVFYMGATRMDSLQQKLLLAGWPPHTPVALIHNASAPNEQLEFHTLESFTSSLLPSPLSIIVGEVAAFNRSTTVLFTKDKPHPTTTPTKED
jgi:uroporphyrinogen III methyltransferase / synthase